jgi:quinol-cytochrome oxidoreductase complex cytochrome b subunit
MSVQSSEHSWTLQDFDYQVPENALRFGYTVGGVAVLGIILLAVTGTLLALFYTPSVDAARSSVVQLSAAPLGMWLRSFHRWTAETVTFLIILHMTRVVFTGSYRGGRRLNWLFGVGLLFVMFAFLFSGTVLKWDQEGYEAYQHALESIALVPLGGGVAAFLAGTTAVMRMFATHVLVLPLLLTLLIVPHLALIKLNGLSTLPGPRTGRTVTFFAHGKRIIAYGAAVYGIVGILAAQFPPALYPGPYAGVEMTKPPWMFLGLYAMEDRFGIIALVVAPIAMLIGLVLVPYLDRKESLHSTMRNAIVWGYSAGIAVMILLIIYVGLTPPVQHLR